MPRAADAALLGGRQLPTDNNPLKRISYQPPKAAFTLEAFLAQWGEFVETYLIPIIEQVTGINLADPTDWPIFGDLIEIFTGIEDGDLSDIGTWVNGVTDAIATLLYKMFLIGDVLEVLTGKEDGDLDDLGTKWNTALGEISETLNTMWNGIMGKDGGYSGITQESAGAAIASQTTALVGMNSAIAQLVAALGTGTPDSDDFERVDSDDLGTSWAVKTNGTGTVSIDGHNASFTIPSTLSSSNGEFVALRSGVAKTDAGIVSCVLADASEWQTFLLPTAFGSLDLWARMSDFTTFAGRTGLRARFKANSTVTLSYFNAGTETVLKTATFLAPPAGAILQLHYGAGGTERRYILTIDNKPVLDATEGVSGVPTVVQIGATYRKRGFGGRAEDPGALIPPAKPARLMQWTAQG